MNKARSGRDLTTGSIPRHLLAVAVPMLIGNLLNTAYHLVDTLWLGRIVGPQAVAATAVSMPVVFIFVAVTAGSTMATSILVSQFYGARDDKSVEKTVGTSFTIAIVMGAVLVTLGILVSDRILKLLNTPASVMPLASLYLKLSFVGFIFMYLSFLVASILRGIGDTRTPLYFMATGVILNAILDPLLIAGPGPFPQWGLKGAAIASIISSATGFIMSVIYLNHKKSVVAFHPQRLNFDYKTSLLIFRIGLPAMIQHSFISIGMAIMTFFVNRFGATAIAAFGAGGRIDSAAFMPAMSIGMAVSTLAGQNIGAGRYDRVRECFFWGIRMTVIISGLFAVIFFCFPSFLISLFVQDHEVIEIGAGYLRIVGPSLVFFAIMFVSNGIINGAGRTMVTLVLSMISLWGIRVPLAWFLSGTPLGIKGIWWSFPVSFVLSMAVSLLYYRSGKWQKNIAGKKPEIPAEILAETPLTEEL